MVIRSKWLVFGIVMMASAWTCWFHWDFLFPRMSRIPLLGWLVEYSIPPCDFYEPSATLTLKTGMQVTDFLCKYIGRYEIDIVDFQGKEFDRSNISMRIVIKDDAGKIIMSDEKNDAEALGTVSHDGLRYLRYCYFVFFSPQDVPLNTNLIAEISCSGDLAPLLSASHRPKIIIRKCFDK